MKARFVPSTAAFTVPRLVLAEASAGAAGSRTSEPASTSDATYFNNAAHPAADPFVLHDARSGYYYAYSTTGAEPGYHFAIYRSPDLVTWQKVPGGAVPANDPGHWGGDWFWAPEVYRNPKTGWYFLFYSARLRDHVAEHFRYPDFEESSKIGVAVSDSPAGPFRNIAGVPIDYFPYDPSYRDINLVMGPDQKKPPTTYEEGRTAPLGTYLPMIDPHVFFDDDGRIYLYYSRNAYRNWVWDTDRHKYVEESNINAVELTADWWNDPTGNTMPTIRPEYRDAHRTSSDAREADAEPGTRRDGYVPILNYGSDKQNWENAHVDDYTRTHGDKKDRRWEEGPSLLKVTTSSGKPTYYLTYSANDYQNSSYGVGYAIADSPLGPFRKSADNPILKQGGGLLSTGHGGIAASPDGAELYYVHHARRSPTENRRLFTSRMLLDPQRPALPADTRPGGDAPALSIEGTMADRPVPSGVTPYQVMADPGMVDLSGGTGEIGWRVTTRSGAVVDLSNPLNRVTATLEPTAVAAVHSRADGATLTPQGEGVAALTLTYQRQKASGVYSDVHNTNRSDSANPEHLRWAPVSVTVPVATCTSTISGPRDGPLVLRSGTMCLRDAQVTGGVHVGQEASLVAVGSTVSGAVTATEPGSVWLSGTAVDGSVHVSGSSGPVRVDRTMIAGALNIADARAAVSVRDSDIRGPTSLRGNSDRVTVAGNTYSAAVSCAGNLLQPTHDKQPDEVRESASGQCPET